MPCFVTFYTVYCASWFPLLFLYENTCGSNYVISEIALIMNTVKERDNLRKGELEADKILLRLSFFTISIFAFASLLLK